MHMYAYAPDLTSSLPASLPARLPAVVQIEDTEFLGASPSGAKRVRINKAAAPGYDVRQVSWQR